jgi:oligopeptide transport system substrate-binding protein
MFSSPRTTATVVAALSVLALAGVGTQATAQPSVPTTIVIGSPAPDSLDPHVTYTTQGWRIANNLFTGLTRFDDRTGTLSLDLAESYTVSPDLMTWTFTLRLAHWSDGRRITAADVAFGIERGQTLTSGPATPSLIVDVIDEVRALDKRTVEIHVSEPAAYLLALLSAPTARPAPQHAIAKHGASWTEPGKIVVSGAYTLASATSTALELVKNKRYYAPAGTVDRATYQLEDSFSTMLDRWRDGEFDFIDQLGAFPASLAADPTLEPDLSVHAVPGTYYLIFNAAHGATANADVRKAFSAATDRARIAEATTGDGSYARAIFTPPGAEGAPSPAGIGIGHDPDAANDYKAAAGAAFPSSITIAHLPGPRPTLVAQILEEDWEATFGDGFDVVTVTKTSGQLQNEMSGPDPAAQTSVWHVGWLYDYPDANNFLGDSVDTVSPRWSNATYDALVGAGASTLDDSDRQAAYADAERILTETEAVVAPIHTIALSYLSRPVLTVVGTRIENWSVS